MKKYSDYPEDVKLFLFELDDVLYPKKDYLLQVYYLFATFIEFSESRPISKEMISFMQETYLSVGEVGLFDKVKARFDLDEKYRDQFGRNHVHAQLPLKLLLFRERVNLIHDLKDKGKQLAILTKGNPLEQLNKMKHIEWHGIDHGLKVYFLDELDFRDIDPIRYIAGEFGVGYEEVVLVDN